VSISLGTFYRVNRRVVVAIATLVTGLGVTVTVGWYTGDDTLVRVRPMFVPMQLSAASAFVMCGIGLLAVQFRVTVLALAALSGALLAGGVTLFEDLSGVDLALDHPFVDSAMSIGASGPVPMANSSALSFVLAAVALLLLLVRGRGGRFVASGAMVGSVVGAIGAVPFLGYLAGVPTAYEWAQLTRMGVHTAAGLVLLGTGIATLAGARDLQEGGTPLRMVPGQVGIGVSVISVLLWQALAAQEHTQIRRTVATNAGAISATVNEQVETGVQALERMAERWMAHGGTPRKEWEVDAAGLVRDRDDYQAIEWVDRSYHVRWIVPLEDNEAALDLDLSVEKRRSVALEASRIGRRVSITQPVDLVQGGKGILVYVPLYVDGRFDGFILGVHRLNRLIATALRSVPKGYDVSVFAGDQLLHATPRSGSEVSDDWIVLSRFDLHGAPWTLRVQPTARRLEEARSRLPEVILGVGLLGALLLAWSIRSAQQAQTRSRQVELVNLQLEDEVSERVRAEGELRTSEERFRLVFEEGPLGMALLARDGRVLVVNARLAEMLGYSAAELERLGFGAVLHPEDVESSQKLAASVFDGDETLYLSDTRYITSSGSTLYARVTGSVVRDEAGKVRYGIAMVEDVTDRRLVEEARKQIFDLSLDIVSSASYDGYFELVNPRFVETLGYSEHELTRTQFLEFLHPDDREAAATEFERLTTETLATDFEMRWHCKDGSYKWLWWRAVAVPEQRRVYGVARDITDKKRMEDSLQQHRDQVSHVLRLHTMGEMASQICHEINQPLGAIVNYARGVSNLLDNKEIDDPKISHGIDQIAEQAHRAGRLIHNIRGFVRRDELHLEDVNVNELIENAEGLLRASGNDDVEFRRALDPGLPHIEADPIQIEQVLVNLLSNGIEATRGTGNGSAFVAIKTRQRDEDTIEVSVRDGGEGLRAAQIDKIFDPFFTTKPDGLGMGLAMSRTIVEAHGGELRASGHTGGGATFTFTLPLHPDIAEAVATDGS